MTNAGSGTSPSLVAICLLAVGPCLSHQNQIGCRACRPPGLNSEHASIRAGAVQVRLEVAQSRHGMVAAGVTGNSVSPGGVWGLRQGEMTWLTWWKDEEAKRGADVKQVPVK